MRKLALTLVFCSLALPLAAQNTDIESLSGLQFNFGNPGARALGMGGAFLGLADDASAAEANPAGLTILRKTEFSVEARNYQEQQLFSTSGTFPDINRTAFSHYSRRMEVTFASVVVPFKRGTIGFYFHEPLRNQGGGQVVPVRNNFTGEIKTDVPNFFLPNPRTNTFLTKAQCEALRKSKNDPFACTEFTILPFLSALDIQEQTFGLAGAWKFGKLSLGAAARYHRFSESAFTFRVTPTFDFSSISVQATSDIRNNNDSARPVHAMSYTGGFKFEVNDKLSFGGSYKKGAKFPAPTFIANDQTNFAFVKSADTVFHIPDVYGAGVSFRPIPVLTINADAVRVTYSNLVDNFISINSTLRAIDKAYHANDVTEIHVGGEYFFATKIPFAIRAGAWRDPAHSVEYRGPLANEDEVATAVLYPKGKNATHLSIGGGLAWTRFQIDVAYERSEHYRVGSASFVARF
jgi:long-chain fatty acid transport protein